MLQEQSWCQLPSNTRPTTKIVFLYQWFIILLYVAKFSSPLLQITLLNAATLQVCRFREGVKYCDEYVCLSVCLFARISRKPNFLCMLTLAVARSPSGGIVIGYVVPVLRMMSYYLTMSSTARYTLFLSDESLTADRFQTNFAQR